jgi:hypothetical protein
MPPLHRLEAKRQQTCFWRMTGEICNQRSASLASKDGDLAMEHGVSLLPVIGM